MASPATASSAGVGEPGAAVAGDAVGVAGSVGTGVASLGVLVGVAGGVPGSLGVGVPSAGGVDGVGVASGGVGLSAGGVGSGVGVGSAGGSGMAGGGAVPTWITSTVLFWSRC